MKRIVVTIMLCLASSAGAAPPPADAVLQARSSIQAIYARQDAAVAQKNVEGALYGYAPDFREVHTEPGVRGMSFTVAQLRPMLQSTLTLAHWLRRRSIIQAIVMTRGGATVTLKQHLVIFLPAPKVHQDGQVLSDSLLSDTWIKGKSGWQEKQSIVLSGRMKVSVYPPARNQKAGQPEPSAP